MIFKMCCNELARAFKYKQATLSKRRRLIFLKLGKGFTSDKKMDRLARAMGIDTSTVNKKLGLLKTLSDKPIEIDVIQPINFCPFCGKQVTRKV